MKFNKLLELFYDTGSKELSLGRVLVLFLSLFYLITGIISFINTGNLIDIPISLMTLILSLYGVQRFSNAYTSVRTNNKIQQGE